MKKTFDLKVIRRPKVILRKETFKSSNNCTTFFVYIYLLQIDIWYFSGVHFFRHYCRCYRYLLPNVSFSAEKNGLRLILWAMKFKLQSRMVTYAALHSIICSSFSSLCIPYTLESRLDVNHRISVPSMVPSF